jgi:hypothetical protein
LSRLRTTWNRIGSDSRAAFAARNLGVFIVGEGPACQGDLLLAGRIVLFSAISQRVGAEFLATIEKMNRGLRFLVKEETWP